jgi:hypothetical protein
VQAEATPFDAAKRWPSRARRAARTAATARSLSLPPRGGANAGRLARKRESWIVRGRAEPVKAVCDRRTTAPVDLPGERTREDDLDRTCPDQEMAAIESKDTNGQDTAMVTLLVCKS